MSRGSSVRLSRWPTNLVAIVTLPQDVFFGGYSVFDLRTLCFDLCLLVLERRVSPNALISKRSKVQSSKYKVQNGKLRTEALLRSVFNRLHNMLIPSATAEIAIQTVTNLFTRWV